MPRRRPAARRRAGRAVQALVVWGLFGGLVWGGYLLVHRPAGAQEIERGVERAEAARMGEVLWDRDCASCHAPDGTGTRWGPNLQGKGPAGVHLAITTGRMPLEELAPLEDRPPGEDARQVRRREVEYQPGQIAAIVEHAREIIEGPDVPTVDVAGADVSEGSQLFQANCASCHSWSTRGGVLTNGHVATSLEESTPTQVVEAMRSGLGTMPEFSQRAVGEEEAADIAAYVDYLRHPQNEGGHPLAYLGPAAEGAVAWAVGLLGLLLLVRWIGSRS